jgi:DNA-binding ferritin-like protein (Dps family)
MGIISKLIGEKKQWKVYKARKKRLPDNYRAAVVALEAHIFYCAPEPAAMMRALDDLIDLFEQSAATKTPIRKIVGDNPADFAEAFISNYTNDSSWRELQMRKVNEALEAASNM